jgi:Ca-activated chloride channel family protein
MIPTSFAQPLWFLALALPVLLIAWECRRRPRPVVVPFDHHNQPRGAALSRLLRLVALLPALLLAVAIVLLAGPQRAGVPQQERVLTNIEFVVDVSGSMMSEFGSGTRFDGSISAIDGFTKHRDGDAFGLTIFGNEVLHWTPLTKDVSALRTAAPFVAPDAMPQQFSGTEIGKALVTTLQRVRSRGEGGILVLISDGISADLAGSRAREVGTQLAASNVVLYAIHIGDEGAPRPLYDLTQPTGGQVFPARNPAALAAVFSHIDRLQPIRVRPSAPQPVDALALPALVGLALLGLHQTALLGLRYTPW